MPANASRSRGLFWAVAAANSGTESRVVFWHTSPLPHSDDKVCIASHRKMGDVMKNSLNVAGLLTSVYARSNHSNSSEPVVVLFFLHGRGENADSLDPTARAAFAWVDEKQASSSNRSPPPRDFILVTFVRGFLGAA
jgi:hypothetical protein